MSFSIDLFSARGGREGCIQMPSGLRLTFHLTTIKSVGLASSSATEEEKEEEEEEEEEGGE